MNGRRETYCVPPTLWQGRCAAGAADDGCHGPQLCGVPVGTGVNVVAVDHLAVPRRGRAP